VLGVRSVRSYSLGVRSESSETRGGSGSQPSLSLSISSSDRGIIIIS
jgi:hypothetical protein